MPGGSATQPGDVVTSHVGADHRDPQHRRRRPPDPVRRAHLRRALQAGGRGRRRHAHRRLRDRARARQPRACSPTTTRWPTSCSRAASRACDRAWRMPLDDEYEEQLKSNFADMANVGRRARRRDHRGLFLRASPSGYPWAHLDIAGTAGSRAPPRARPAAGAAADRVPPGACRRRRRLNASAHSATTCSDTSMRSKAFAGPDQVPASGDAFSCSRATATEMCSVPASLLLVGSKPCQPAPGR